jgi:hypothetical protein
MFFYVSQNILIEIIIIVNEFSDMHVTLRKYFNILGSHKYFIQVQYMHAMVINYTSVNMSNTKFTNNILSI